MAHHTVGNWETAHLDNPTQWFLLSRAYLDGSLRLCQAMIAGDYPVTYQHGQVVMGLCRQAVELFFKGVIWKAIGTAPDSHSLLELEQTVRLVAPDVAEFFACPFFAEEVKVECDPKTKEKLIALKAQSAKTLDQQLRYHVDRHGNPWPGVHGFRPDLFLAKLQYCSTQFEMVVYSLAEQGETPKARS